MDKILVSFVVLITAFIMGRSTYKTFKRGTFCSNCRYNKKSKDINK